MALELRAVLFARERSTLTDYTQHSKLEGNELRRNLCAQTLCRVRVSMLLTFEVKWGMNSLNVGMQSIVFILAEYLK
eukprot:4279784-Amphidinium_carterae.1